MATGIEFIALDQIEILLLVSSPPVREWSTVEVDSVIRSNPEIVSRWLEGFVVRFSEAFRIRTDK